MSRFRAALFDWDGTLLDSAEASYRCYVRLFASFGIAFGREDFARSYSPDWRRTYRALGVPEPSWPLADSRWLELYREERGELLPGARAALGRLAAAGLVLGLVTSGNRPRVEEDLARLSLAGSFAAVVCGTDLEDKKPHPAGLLLALARLGVGPGEAVYLGDSPEDVEMARAAGVFAIGIPGAFPNREALEASRPDRLAPDLAEAVAAVLGGT